MPESLLKSNKHRRRGAYPFTRTTIHRKALIIKELLFIFGKTIINLLADK